MKRLNYLCATFLLLTIINSTIFGQKRLPSTELKTIEGQTVDISDEVNKGQITVISFWATWCAPCKLELDAIADIYEDWQNDYNIRLLAISVDDARAAAKVGPMVAEKGWPFDIFTDTNQDLMRSLSFQSIPYTLLLNQTGEIVYTHTGYLPGDEEELETQIQAISPQ